MDRDLSAEEAPEVGPLQAALQAQPPVRRRPAVQSRQVPAPEAAAPPVQDPPLQPFFTALQPDWAAPLEQPVLEQLPAEPFFGRVNPLAAAPAPYELSFSGQLAEDDTASRAPPQHAAEHASRSGEASSAPCHSSAPQHAQTATSFKDLPAPCFDDATGFSTPNACSEAPSSPLSPHTWGAGTQSDSYPASRCDTFAVAARHIIQVSVERSSRVDCSFLVERPVVRVHVVDRATGLYLPRPGAQELLSPEQQTHMLQEPGHDTMVTVQRGEGEFCVGTLSYVPPIQTQEAHVRQALTPSGDCVWREPVLLDLDFNLLRPAVGHAHAQPDVLMLFEILQHPPSMQAWRQHRSEFARDGTHRVAWAFLDVTDAVRPRLSQPLQLQLFRWPEKLKGVHAAATSNPRDAGPVFQAYQAFRLQAAPLSATTGSRTWWARSGAQSAPVPVEPFPAALHVHVEAVERLDLRDTATFNQTLGKQTFRSLPAGSGSGWDNYRPGTASLHRLKRTLSMEEKDSQTRACFTAALERRLLEPCELPNALHARQAPGAQGCSVCAFSHDGLKLAVAVERSHRHYVIQVYDVATNKLRFQFDGHALLVYELSWSADDSALVSCASDCTAKVWLLDAAQEAQRGSLNAGDVAHTLRPTTASSSPRRELVVASAPYCTVISHASFVYSCAFHPGAALRAGNSTGSATAMGATPPPRLPFLLLATACCDGYLYLWNACAGYEALAKVLVCTRTLEGWSSAVNAVVWAPGAANRKLGSLRPTLLYTGDSRGHVKEWACRVLEDGCRFDNGGAAPARATDVGAPVACIRINPAGTRLVALTKAHRLMVLDLRTMDVVAMLGGLQCGTHPIKFALDPDSGRWLAAGSEDGRVCLFDLDSGRAEPQQQLLEIDLGSEGSPRREGGKGTRGGPVYCVAWNAKLHVMAICSRQPGGHMSVVVHDKALAASEPAGGLFSAVPSSGLPAQIPARLAFADPGTRPSSRQRRTFPEPKYDVPEKLDRHYIRGLLDAIRDDLTAKGLLAAGGKLTGRQEDVLHRPRRSRARKPDMLEAAEERKLLREASSSADRATGRCRRAESGLAMQEA